VKCLVLLAACAPPVAPHPVTLQPCQVAGVKEPLQCGTLDVPEDHAHPEGRRLQLPIVVLPGPHGHGLPRFLLDGGPGMAASPKAALFANELSALRATGDIVLVDQRGTGDGPSALACPELDGAKSPFPIAAVRACRDSLASRADVRFYGTLDVARDVDAARAALGYDRIDIEAVSYGTRVAQAYMKLYPSRVRAVVMFGALAMDVHLPADFAPAGQHGLDQLVDDCAHDAACAAAYPELRAQLAQVAPARLPDGVDRGGFSEQVRHALALPAGARRLPLAIARAAAGDFAVPALPPAHSREAVALAVTCSEDIPAIDRERDLARASQTWFGDYRLRAQLAACDEWPHAPYPRDMYEPVASDVPVLIGVGGRDSITPPEYARRAVQRMPHAQLVDIPWSGHVPIGLAHLECLDAIELAFLKDPYARVDASCVASMLPPRFATTTP
jgi:pimeloyl-ACP methyl ester carboxylesterase